MRSTGAELPSSSDSPSHFVNACVDVQPAGTVNVYPWALDVNASGFNGIDGEHSTTGGVTLGSLEAGDDEPDDLPVPHDAMTEAAASRDR